MSKDAIIKEYKIKIKALPKQHKIFTEFIRRFYFTENLEKYNKLVIEEKNI